jgi:fatty acid-binding protein DegV
MQQVRLGIAHADDPRRAEWYAERLTSTLRPRLLLLTELSPIIAIHGGRGAVGIALTPCDS